VNFFLNFFISNAIFLFGIQDFFKKRFFQKQRIRG
jgi:hypothetical protein